MLFCFLFGQNFQKANKSTGLHQIDREISIVKYTENIQVRQQKQVGKGACGFANSLWSFFPRVAMHGLTKGYCAQGSNSTRGWHPGTGISVSAWSMKVFHQTYSLDSLLSSWEPLLMNISILTTHMFSLAFCWFHQAYKIICLRAHQRYPWFHHKDEI